MGAFATSSIGSQPAYAAVAISDDNSVAVFRVVPQTSTTGATLIPLGTVSGIPSPYSITGCDLETSAARLVVTSPSDNSISIFDVNKLTVVAKITVGAQPFSATCFPNSSIFVSNYGDSSISVVDIRSLAVKTTIPGVPGSRALRGIASFISPAQVWVCGTDANIVTVFDPVTLSITARIPVKAPTLAVPDFDQTSREQLVGIGTPLDNSILRFRLSSLTLASTISGIPDLKDYFPALPNFLLWGYATTGPNNSVAVLDDSGVHFLPESRGQRDLLRVLFMETR